MKDSAVETRGKARQDHKEEASKRGRPRKAENKEVHHDESDSEEHMEEARTNGEEEKPKKRGRPRKAENKEDRHDESDEEEHTNGEEGKTKKTKQPKQEHDGDEEMNGTENSKAAEEFEDFREHLHNNVSVEEIHTLLQENGLDTLGSEEELYQRSADLLFFGTCEICPSCGGVLEYSGQTYHCSSYSTEWAKCNYSTPDGRKGGKAKIPTKLKSDFLKKWVKSHTIATRQLDPENKLFSGMTFVIAGRMSRLQEEIRQTLEEYGGKVVGTVREGVTAILSSDQEVQGGGSSKLSDAMDHGLPVCRESWLADSIEKMKALPLGAYNMVNADGIPWDQRAPEEEAAAAVTADLKLYGKRSVYKDTELEEEGGKIYEKDDIIYNCAFSVCDIYLALNQYAVLQLIEVETAKKYRRGSKKSDIYLYVKEGRVGDRRGVRERLDKQASPQAAVREFTKVFEQLTGNKFLEWEREKKFSKQRNKYFPIDMRLGVDARAGALEAKQLGIAALHSEVDSRVVEYLKILFSQTTYRSAMTEIGVDAPDLPNGNLTNWHINLCQKHLHVISGYLKKGEDNEQKTEQVCLDFSNKWFTLLHSTRPFIIHDLVQLAELAAPTFETVRDISHASMIIGDMSVETMNDSFGSIADRYAKLDCAMTPLDREGEDYKMILNYFNKTMEPLKFAGADYGVTIEDIVQLESKAGPSLDDICKVHNRMLLWCGMRTSNLIANLHRGLLPAPIEAPAPYYSFGKGIYCTDAAVKAAQYGFTSVDRNEGFLLLSIVGLESRPEMPCPDKPVEEYEKEGGCAKINGKRGPEQKEYFQWKYEVMVPCGTLKDTNVEGVRDFMDYNEYVSYDPMKVKPMFLVKTKFKEITPMSKFPLLH